ncbi:hypothetical protein [Inquilinus sp.]
MKLKIETPAHLVDVNGLGLDTIEATPENGLRIGRHRWRSRRRRPDQS